MLSLKRVLIVCFALVAAVSTIYSYAWHCEFIDYDDNNHVVENPTVQAGLTWGGVKTAFTQFHAGQWIPLTWVSHMTDVSLFGMDAGAHHLVNVALHALNACLLFLGLTMLTKRFWPSAVLALIFAVHPINVESVAWIAERKNMLSTMFWFLALIAYAWHAKSRSIGSMAVVAICMAAGLLCKSMLVTLPFVLLLLDFWPLERFRQESWRKLVMEKLPLFALAISASLVTSRAAISADGLVPLSVTPVFYRVCNALANYGIYAGKLILPGDLAILYPLPPTAPYALAAVSAVAIILALILAWRCRARAPYVLVGLLWFLGVLVPVSGLVQVGKNVLADRFTYVPQIGLFMVVVWGAAAAVQSRPSLRRPLIALASAAVICLAWRTSDYLRHWKNSATVFLEAAEATDDNGIARANAGFALAKMGALTPAIAQYRLALAIAPHDVNTRTYLGAALSRAGQAEAALQEFHQVLKYDPHHFEAHLSIATQLIKAQQPRKAIQQLVPLLNRTENPYLVNYWMARAWQDAGDRERAIQHYVAALQSRPGDVRATEGLRTAGAPL